jgi:hypothetical protein
MRAMPTTQLAFAPGSVEKDMEKRWKRDGKDH